MKFVKLILAAIIAFSSFSPLASAENPTESSEKLVITSEEPLRNSEAPVALSSPPPVDNGNLENETTEKPFLPKERLRSAGKPFGSQLSSEQKAALAAAKENGFTVRSTDLLIDGRVITVIILGESHIKSSKVNAAGNALLAQFPFRGLEGATFDLGIIGNAMLHITKKLQELTPEKNSSTLVDSRNSGYYFRATGEVTFDGKNIGNMKLGTAEKNEHSVFGKIASARNSVDKRPLVFESDQAWKDSHPNAPISVGLEYGDLSIWEPKCTLMCTPIYTPLIIQRNYRMAANVLSTLKAFPERNVMLVIAGYLHGPGMAKILEDNAGVPNSERE